MVLIDFLSIIEDTTRRFIWNTRNLLMSSGWWRFLHLETCRYLRRSFYLWNLITITHIVLYLALVHIHTSIRALLNILYPTTVLLRLTSRMNRSHINLNRLTQILIDILIIFTLNWRSCCYCKLLCSSWNSTITLGLRRTLFYWLDLCCFYSLCVLFYCFFIDISFNSTEWIFITDIDPSLLFSLWCI